MAKFAFKLQSLLNVKTQMEDSVKNELGKATKRLEEEKAVLRQIEGEMHNCILKFNSESAAGVRVEKLKEYSLYVSYLKEKAGGQKDHINIAREIVDNYREQLIRVMQEKEMLEKLKEAKYQEYLKDSLREEQRINDEIISFKYMNTLTEDKDGTI